MTASTISALPDAGVLTGQELLELVQDGQNVKLQLHDLFPDTVLQDAPADQKQYVRVDGQWKLIDLSVANTKFATAAATFELDLAAAQLFRVSMSEDRALTFKNPPVTGEGMNVFVVLLGNTGTLTWPSGINWEGDGMSPQLGSQWTLVRLIYDGVVWRGMIEGAK